MNENNLAAVQEHKEIFQAGSKTYFNSSLFFPHRIRTRVYTLYAFVRIADNYVDEIPQKDKEFRDFRRRCEEALQGNPAGDTIIDPFVKLCGECSFDQAWVTAFLDSMEADLSKKNYDTLEENFDIFHFPSPQYIFQYKAKCHILIHTTFYTKILSSISIKVYQKDQNRSSAAGRQV